MRPHFAHADILELGRLVRQSKSGNEDCIVFFMSAEGYCLLLHVANQMGISGDAGVTGEGSRCGRM